MYMCIYVYDYVYVRSCVFVHVYVYVYDYVYVWSQPNGTFRELAATSKDTNIVSPLDRLCDLGEPRVNRSIHASWGGDSPSR